MASKRVTLTVELEVQEGATPEAVVYVITNVLRNNGLVVVQVAERHDADLWEDNYEDYA